MAVATGAGVIVTVSVAIAPIQVPLGGIVFVMVYEPGALNDKLTSPVLVLTNTKPAGAAEKEPALAPSPKIGKGLFPY